ncbi:hypothetical protein C8Q76DRAFT_727913 [Earliella scabrosa]|nr:hypothetical protein C8Q76DRAFT_727913 [Earliella scabrosa]
MNVLLALQAIMPAVLWIETFTIATPINRTIDDFYGDSVTGLRPTYSPANQWISGDQCRGCDATPLINGTAAFNRTWHDSTYHTDQLARDIMLRFTGTAVYVYHIILNKGNNPLTTTLTNLSFYMDDVYVGNYTHQPEDNHDVLYNVSVYVNTTLINKPHVLHIRADGPQASLILFDYAEYTFDDTSSPSNTSVTAPRTPSSHFSSTSLLPSFTAQLSPSSLPVVHPAATPSSSTWSPQLAPSSPVTHPATTPESSPSLGSTKRRPLNVGAVAAILITISLCIGFLACALAIARRRRRRRTSLKRISEEGAIQDPPSGPPIQLFEANEHDHPTPLPPIPASSAHSSHVTLPSSAPSRAESSYTLFDAAGLTVPILTKPAVDEHPTSSPARGDPDVPAPAVSITATSTARIARIEQLDRDLQMLEALLHRPSRAARSRSDEDQSVAEERHGGRMRRDVDPADEKRAALQSEVASLQRQLAYEKRLLVEALPRRR